MKKILISVISLFVFFFASSTANARDRADVAACYADLQLQMRFDQINGDLSLLEFTHGVDIALGLLENAEAHAQALNLEEGFANAKEALLREAEQFCSRGSDTPIRVLETQAVAEALRTELVALYSRFKPSRETLICRAAVEAEIETALEDSIAKLSQLVADNFEALAKARAADDQLLLRITVFETSFSTALDNIEQLRMISCRSSQDGSMPQDIRIHIDGARQVVESMVRFLSEYILTMPRSGMILA